MQTMSRSVRAGFTAITAGDGLWSVVSACGAQMATTRRAKQ